MTPRHIAMRMLRVLWLHMLILKEFGSSCVNCHFDTCSYNNILLLTPIERFGKTSFMTVLHRCESHKVRQFVIEGLGSVFFKNRKITKALF